MHSSKLLPLCRKVASRNPGVWGPFFASRVRGYPGYRNFGHKREAEPLITKITLGIFGAGLVVSVMDWRWVRMLYLHHAGQLEQTKTENPAADALDKDGAS